ncbi:hypothetical protein KY290_033557 [Solanum tuberosum]|uniref:Uncharacterized protein n=1 Tax=Solanum tuberosum TaxID=4113 RepID=A0ABQ7U0M9_SOLTU|nr:hypothetical protein KY289_032922 [Solanum tuberosum]KAH0740514.1 hypothetical protein KY290_033557 [Solanum tuberosum]
MALQLEHAAPPTYTPTQLLCELLLTTNYGHGGNNLLQQQDHSQRGRRQHGEPGFTPNAESLSPVHLRMNHSTKEEEPNIPGKYIQALYLRNSLTVDLQQNIERKFLVKVPKEITMTSLNICYYNSNAPLKYVTLIIPTMKDKQPLEEMEAESSNSRVNLEVTLAPGGIPTTYEQISMKILLWNCRGAHNIGFMCEHF